MSATTVDRNTKMYLTDDEFSYPVKTLISIPMGTFVGTDSTGYLTKATDSASLKLQGVSMEAADNSAGLDGAINCKVRKHGSFDFACSGLAITDVGCDLYLSDNQTVTKTATNVYVGKMVKFVSSTVVTVSINAAINVSPSSDSTANQASIPVAATTSITANRLCCYDGSGNLVHAADTAGYQLAGESTEAVNNSSGGAGDLDCIVQRDQLFTAVASGLTDVDVGKPCWITNSTTIQLTPGNVFAGFIASVASATSCKVDLTAACNAKKFEDMGLVLLPLAASANVGANDFVCSKVADGYCTNASLTTSGYKLEGIALHAANNTGADGTLSVLVRRNGMMPKTSAGLTLADAGKPCWITDKDTVTLTPGGVFAGFIAQYVSATACIVDITAGCNSHRLQDHGFALLPVAASANISANDLVCSKAADGFATNASLTTAGYHLEGVAIAPADNNAGADGAINVLIKRSMQIQKTLASVAITDIGKPCWVADADTVTLTPGNVFAGVISKYVTTNTCIVDTTASVNMPRKLGRVFPMTFSSAVVPNVIPFTSFEFPVAVKLLRGYFQLGTAPGGSDTAVATITDGSNAVALTATAAEVAAENEAIDQVYPPNTDMSVAFTRSGASAAQAQVTYWFEQL